MLSFIRFVGLSVDEVNLVSGDKLRLVLDAYVEYVASGGNGASIECGGGLHVSARRALLLGGDSVCSDSFVYGGEHGGASMVRRTGDCVCGAARGAVEEIRGQFEGGVGGDTSPTGVGGGVGASSAVADESGLPGCDVAGVSASSGDDFGRVGNIDELPVSDGVRSMGSEPVADQNVCGGVVRGKHYESNRRKRLSRKKRNASGRVDVGSVKDWRNPGGISSVDEVDQNVPTLRESVERRVDSEIFDKRCADLEERMADEVAAKSAKRTLNEKWAMENKLAAAKAKRALEILEAQDLQTEIKKQSTYLKLQTEKNMVGMEKAHQFLKKTGNVPGFAQTVVSDEGLTDGSSASPVSPGECTISPDSSASMKDYRELAKKCADQQAKLEQFHKMTKIHPDYIELYKKQTWTINSENIRILDEMYPQGHALNPIPDYENYDAPTHGELIVGSDEEYFPY